MYIIMYEYIQYTLIYSIYIYIYTVYIYIYTVYIYIYIYTQWRRQGGNRGNVPPPPKSRKFPKGGNQTLDNPAKLVRPSKKT